jgi:hypothetical protein
MNGTAGIPAPSGRGGRQTFKHTPSGPILTHRPPPPEDDPGVADGDGEGSEEGDGEGAGEPGPGEPGGRCEDGSGAGEADAPGDGEPGGRCEDCPGEGKAGEGEPGVPGTKPLTGLPWWRVPPARCTAPLLAPPSTGPFPDACGGNKRIETDTSRT